MKALRFHARGDLRIDDVDEPVVRSGWVIVDVEWAGICGSDLHEFRDGPLNAPHGTANAVTGDIIPIIMGHEFAGTVSAVGSDVTSVKPGDRVAVEPIIRCRECEQCERGNYNLCERIALVGVHGGSGGFSPRALVPAYGAHKLPDSVPTYVGALVEPLAVAWHSVRNADFQPGQTALVMGAGPIGLATLLCLRAFGASKVFVAVRRPGARSRLASVLGADAVLDSTDSDVPKRLLELTGGRGADLVFETTGSQRAMDNALAAVARGGSISTLAVWPKPGRFDFMALFFKEARLIGSMCYAHDFPEVIAALADGRISGAELLITKRVPLEEGVTEGFGALLGDGHDQVKVLIHP